MVSFSLTAFNKNRICEITKMPNPVIKRPSMSNFDEERLFSSGTIHT